MLASMAIIIIFNELCHYQYLSFAGNESRTNTENLGPTVLTVGKISLR
jgi:hypothetical protein